MINTFFFSFHKALFLRTPCHASFHFIPFLLIYSQIILQDFTFEIQRLEFHEIFQTIIFLSIRPLLSVITVTVAD